MVRQRFAKPSYAGSNPVLTSTPGPRGRRSGLPLELVLAGAVCLAVALPGCSSAPTGATTAEMTAASIRAVDERLRGSWRLVSFVPETPLGPALQAMLEYQYQAMVIRFEGGRIKAESPGIHFDRRYEVREVKGDRFTLISYEDGGIPYASVCEFGPNETLIVYSQDAPWKGVGTLRRAPV